MGKVLPALGNMEMCGEQWEKCAAQKLEKNRILVVVLESCWGIQGYRRNLCRVWWE